MSVVLVAAKEYYSQLTKQQVLYVKNILVEKCTIKKYGPALPSDLGSVGGRRTLNSWEVTSGCTTQEAKYLRREHDFCLG
jgi:hypothetical protein